MRFFVIGDVAVLASRKLERIKGKCLTVDVVGVPDGATLYIQHKTVGVSYGIVSESTRIPLENLQEEGRYTASILWSETDPQSKETMQHEASGISFCVIHDSEGKAILPASLSSSQELEYMWRGLINTLEVFLPFLDSLKNGNDVI